MQWTEFSAWWIRQALDSLYADWRRVGAFPGASPATRLIDPEALIAATWTVGRMDARLFDTTLQWSAENAELLDRIRLKASLGLMGVESSTVGLAWWDCLGGGVGKPPTLNPQPPSPVALFGMDTSVSASRSPPIFGSASPHPQNVSMSAAIAKNLYIHSSPMITRNMVKTRSRFKHARPRNQRRCSLNRYDRSRPSA